MAKTFYINNKFHIKKREINKSEKQKGKKTKVEYKYKQHKIKFN